MPSDHEQRAHRQQAIVSLLGEARVTNQAELVELLRSRGISATQSSVSRDLRDLGVAWIGGRYALPALAAGSGSPGEAPEPGLGEVSRFLREARPAGPHLTVVTTAPGAAQGVAFALDRAGWPEAVGTLAGDDTLFVATSTAADQQRLLSRLRGILPEG